MNTLPSPSYKASRMYSRDIIARFDELDTIRRDLLTTLQWAKGSELREVKAKLRAWKMSTEGHDWLRLQGLIHECEGYGQWRSGETLIADEDFAQYAHDLAEDSGAMNDPRPWPLTCIDWDRAIRELKLDYMSVTYYGSIFWMRA